MDPADVEEAVRTAVDFVIPIIEVIGAAVVFYGAIVAIIRYVLSAVGVRHTSYEEVRLTLGRHLALGTFKALGTVAAIIVIRQIIGRGIRAAAG
jgi:uncharacterized membrane protein